ncbi:glycosyltransferase, partial [bacterium]|nr:glycosyltransferase [bacterium]
AAPAKRLMSSWATIISLSKFTRNNLENLGFKRKINFIPAGIRPGHLSRQDNIFNKLAETEAEKNQKKFFTIGTITALNDNQQLEKLFSAIKKSLTVIPNLQLIIIGNGKEKKKLKWTVKKMGISPIVWFVGEQAILKKWIDNFDIYISVVRRIDLNDLFSTIQVAASGIPIIGPTNIGLEDIITNSKEGFLININDNEILTQSIIKLQQNKTLRRQISQKLKNKIDNNNSIDKMVKQFKEICTTN